jgi:hypothetical protein
MDAIRLDLASEIRSIGAAILYVGKGYGINRVDPVHYQGRDGALSAGEFDAVAMNGIACERCFETQRLVTHEATRDAVSPEISRRGW